MYATSSSSSSQSPLSQDLAKKCAAQKVHPLRVKKLYVLAALEIEKFKKRTLEMAGPDKTAATLLGTGGTAGGGTATMAATAAQVGGGCERACRGHGVGWCGWCGDRRRVTTAVFRV